MPKASVHKNFVKIYHGYGHTNDLLLYGHVFNRAPVKRKHYSAYMLPNLVYLLRLFFIRPVAYVPVQLQWQNQQLSNTTESDGFIKFEWSSLESVPAGWHPVTVSYKTGQKEVLGNGELFVPHKTQYGFISDIDDTIMISHSATVLKRLKVLFTSNPHTRKVFPGVQEHYQLLSASGTTTEAPNPFFYVSSSEWNLYDYLEDFFSFNKLPRGAFLLNHVKQWRELLKTGKTKHGGKLIRVTRILQAFPHQQFILIGDNTQQDPVIYKAIAEKYPGRIHAIYIRNVLPANEASTSLLLQQLQRETGVHTCLFIDSKEAIVHSKAIGLIR